MKLLKSILDSLFIFLSAASLSNSFVIRSASSRREILSYDNTDLKREYKCAVRPACQAEARVGWSGFLEHARETVSKGRLTPPDSSSQP